MIFKRGCRTRNLVSCCYVLELLSEMIIISLEVVEFLEGEISSWTPVTTRILQRAVFW